MRNRRKLTRLTRRPRRWDLRCRNGPAMTITGQKPPAEVSPVLPVSPVGSKHDPWTQSAGPVTKLWDSPESLHLLGGDNPGLLAHKSIPVTGLCTCSRWRLQDQVDLRWQSTAGRLQETACHRSEPLGRDGLPRIGHFPEKLVLHRRLLAWPELGFTSEAQWAIVRLDGTARNSRKTRSETAGVDHQ